MRLSLRLILPVITLCSLVSLGAALAQDKKSEWVDLLSKGDLAKNWNTKGNWTQAEDGTTTLTPRKGESGWSRWDAYLWSKKEYTDFEIEFEYRVEKGSNSGFYFRVGDLNNPVAKGIEVQIYDSFGKAADKLGDHDSGGVIPGIKPLKNSAKAAGEWNKFQITSKGDKLTVVLNGETVNEVDLAQDKLKGRPKTGYIGFQDHALPLALRNIRIKE
jgi:hypothetical protein